jgi:hypothetical protein
VHRHDPRMFEPRQDLRFLAQTLVEVVGRRRGIRDLDRDFPAELLVACRVDGPHAAAADRPQDRVAIGGQLRPRGDVSQAFDEVVREPRHRSTSIPNSSRASRRNSSAVPQRP